MWILVSLIPLLLPVSIERRALSVERYALRSNQKPFLTDLVSTPALTYSYQFNLELGRVYLNLKNYPQAKRYLTKALNLAETDSEKGLVFYTLGRMFLFAQKPDSAVRYLGEVLKYNPSPGLDFLYTYGLALFELGKDEDAFSVLTNLYAQITIKRAFEWSKSGTELLTLLGLVALKTGKTDQAELYLVAIPESIRVRYLPEINYLLALVYYKKGELAKAQSSLSQIQDYANCDKMLKRKALLLLGTIQLKQGENLLACQTFETIIQDSFQYGKDHAYLMAGLANYRGERYDQAISLLESVRGLARSGELDLNEYSLYLLTQIYLKLKKYRLAIEKNYELRACFPKSEFLKTTIFQIGHLHYEHHNYSQAFREFKNFLNLFPDSPNAAQALLFCAQSAMRLNEPKIAIELLRQLLEKYPSSPYTPEAFYSIGVIQLDLKDYTNAKAHFSQVSASPFYPFALKGIGDAYFGLTQYDSALCFYQKACSSLYAEFAIGNWSGQYDTLLSDVRFAIATSELKLGKYANYIVMLDSYLKDYPFAYNAASLQYEIGQYFYERGEFLNGLREFYKVFDYNPTKTLMAKTYLAIAQTYFSLGVHERAITALNYIVTTFADTTSVIGALTLLAETYTQNLAYDSAINCYLQILTKYPNRNEAQTSLVNIASLYQKMNKTVEAKLTLDRLIKEYPNSSLLKSVYEKMIDLLISEGNLSYAETVINHYTQKFGAGPLPALQLGKIRKEQNRLEEAKKLFLQSAAELNEDSRAEALIFAADVCLKLSDTAEAQTRLNQAYNSAKDERIRIKCQELLNKLHSTQLR